MEKVLPIITGENITADEKIGIAPKTMKNTAESFPDISFTIRDNSTTEANQVESWRII